MSSSAILARVARASLFHPRAYTVRPMRTTSFQPSSPFKPATSAFFSTTSRTFADPDPHDPHHEESFEEFTAR
jgi:cytochrome c oxidase subunit 5a